jgi:hypothetical protein
MAVLTIEDLLIKFGAGKSPRSQDYLDLIDTLADDRNAVYFSGTAPADTAANPLWFNTSTNVLSAYSSGSWRSAEGTQGPAGATGAQGPQGETGPTGVYRNNSEPANTSLLWVDLDDPGSFVPYSAPTLGSTSVGSGATVTNVNGLTVNSTTIPTSKTIVVTTDKLNVHAATTSSELAGVISDETGSGALVFGTSPTLVTPEIGVATATSINGTTIPSTKTLVVTTDKLSTLAATTSAELAGIISDETGTGALVFADSPTLVTPVLGVATATSINGTTIPSSKTLVATDSTTFVVPSQTGNSGKYLTTNGTASSWGAVDALPSQTGNTGKYLTTDGTAASWGTVTAPNYEDDQAILANQIFG